MICSTSFYFNKLSECETLMIYIDENPQDINMTEALSAVSQQRRDYALRYRREQDRRQCLSAYLLLQKALRQEYGIVEPPLFSFTPKGKPLLRDYPDIHFSLSHCQRATICAISGQPVGIDIESIDAYDPTIVSVTMSGKEQDAIAKAPSPAVAFIRLWTKKESLMKFVGEGLMIEQLPSILEKDIPHHFVTHENLTLGYIYTMCEGE